MQHPLLTSVSQNKTKYLLASDFDKTLSFNDSGFVLSDMLGIKHFEQKVADVSSMNLIQQGGELAYLLTHDAEFAQVRREDLIEVGHRIQLKYNIHELVGLLNAGIADMNFSFYVISAAPKEVIESALMGLVPTEHIFGTQFDFDPISQKIIKLRHVPAGYGKVSVLRKLQTQLQIADERVIYAGDGSSDIHVMLHVNQHKGYTIAMSQSQYVTQIAKRTVLSDNACSVLVPVLEDIFMWPPSKIRSFYENSNLLIQEWVKIRTDWLTMLGTAGQD